MLAALERVAEVLALHPVDSASFPWWRLRYVHSQWVRSVLAARYSPAHANKCLSALRGVLKECWRLGLMTREEFERTRDIEEVRGKTLPRGRALSSPELARLLATARGTGNPAGVRDAALLSVLWGGGLRRSELVALDLEDLALDAGELVVRKGKGRKARRLYLPAEVVQALRDWVRVRGKEPGPLFVRVLRGGHVQFERLTDQTVYDVLGRRSRKAGLAPVSPHDLRRTTATDLLRSGVDLGVVQRILGHESVVTTLRYDHRGEEAQREAVLHLKVFSGQDGGMVLPGTVWSVGLEA